MEPLTEFKTEEQTRKCTKSKCESTSHKLLKEKAKNRVTDLQGMFTNLQSARKESRAHDIAVLEEQMHQVLREWNSELNEPSPASSLVGDTLGSFSNDLARLLEQIEEEDDATSALAEPKAETNLSAHQNGGFVNHELQQNAFDGYNECKDFDSSQHNIPVFNNSDLATESPSHHLAIHQHLEHTPITHMEGRLFYPDQEFDYELFIGPNDNTEPCGQNIMSNILPNISPPPSAFLGPKCALWDCFRPAQGSEWCRDYCSSVHSVLALNEGLDGMTPILRPGGTGLKDGPLFTALNAKTEAKSVGIPTCEGAATMKCPWNAPELFDISFIEGETLREWLFFDRPRRAFESGNRKQRSLPDYKGRGWHESRKQVVKEFKGRKRSYYMDPQPSTSVEWHLYEYEIENNETFALYRLELKGVDLSKKSPKGKLGMVGADPLVDLQKKMGRLTAEVADEKGGSSS